MTKKTTEVFAIDLGNGYVKAKSSKRELLAPSNLATIDAIGEEGLFQDTKRGITYHVYQQANDPTEYVWGPEVSNPKFVEPSRLIETYKKQNRYEQLYFQKLFEFILAELASDFGESVDVVVVAGLPSSEVGTSIQTEMTDELKGKHLVSRDGEEFVINVKAVNIMEQPLGTLLDIYMADGDLMPEFIEDRIAIIDFGAGTTILDIYQQGKRLNDSETYKSGMKNIYQEVLGRLQKEYPDLNLSRLEVEEAFREGLVLKYSKRKTIDIEDIAKQETKKFVSEMINKINAQIDKNRIDVFILTGGGVNIVLNDFIEMFGVPAEDIKTPENTQTAGVNGFFKLGESLVSR